MRINIVTHVNPVSCMCRKKRGNAGSLFGYGSEASKKGRATILGSHLENQRLRIENEGEEILEHPVKQQFLSCKPM